MEASQTLRIIDANLNRIGEGLRFLEDVARLVFNDTGLTRQLKDMRHGVLISNPAFQQQLLQARDATGDVGVDIEAAGDENQKELPTAIVANSRRVQEALRVLEEIAKIPGLTLAPEKFKRARFELYTIERNLLSRLLRQDKIKRLPGLHIVIDSPAVESHNYIEIVSQAIHGLKAIHLHDRVHSKKELLAVARELKKLCTERNLLFIINDYLDLTLAVDADGLQLEPESLPVEIARRLLPIDKLLGIPVLAADQAIAAQSQGADYIAVDLTRPAAAGEMEDAAEWKKLRQVRSAVTLPLVAITDKTNASRVLDINADAIALIGAPLRTEEIEKVSQQIAERNKNERFNG